MSDYPKSFYENRHATVSRSARKILPHVPGLAGVKSVVDVGCGDGSWLFVLQEDYGKDDILGIDGPWIHEDQLNIPKDCFLRAPLDEALPVNRSFDMAISLEVAEHLPETRAEGFVEDLTKLAPLILFSAAVPGQGGTNHVNEQWQDYWIALFGNKGFLPINCMRWPIWNEPDVPFWYRQNTFLYASQSAIDSQPELRDAQAAYSGYPLNVVHPDLHRMMMKATRPGLGRLLKMIPASLGETYRRRVRRR